MSASEHVNEVLFHGTSKKFKAGEMVLPASKTGVRQNWGAKSKNDPDVAYATDQLDSAKYFAGVAALMKDGRPRVYQVEPVGEGASWVNTRFGKEQLRQHVSPEGYRVVKRVWLGRSQ